MKRILKRKKPIYNEYFVNHNHFEKLYNMYLDKALINKILDILVFFAIIFTIMSFVMKHIIELHPLIFYIVNSSSAVILFIFILELLRQYAKSHSSKVFLKQHWIDFTLISILSLYFVFVTIFGFGKFFILNFLKAEASEAKYFRVFFNLFKR